VVVDLTKKNTVVILADCVGLVEQQLLDAKLFFGHGTDNAFDEAAWLVMSAAGIDIDTEPMDWRQVLTDAQQTAIKQLSKRRIETRKPLAYLVKQAWFAGHEFYVDERAIIPRSHLGGWIPDRLHPWLGRTPVKAVLDLCTGSGCIAVAIAIAFPEAKVDAVDVSSVALEVAAINIDQHAMRERIRLLQGDLFNAVGKSTRYDVIVCNPPYVSNQSMELLSPEHRFEPRLALAGGSDGLDYVHRVLTEARWYLKEKGRLFVETGSMAAIIEKTWPSAPFTWLTSSTGESVVLTFTGEELENYGEHFQRGGQ
jgi:ribosomal protein L3 glutamine methyltransferase